jgi:hypothetical protein
VPAVVAVLIGTAWAAISWANDHGAQLVNAGAWWWGWLVLPVAAAALGAWTRRRRAGLDAWLIAAFLVAPMGVAFAAHDAITDRRPAYWPVGVVLLVVLAVICTAAASAAGRDAETT